MNALQDVEGVLLGLSEVLHGPGPAVRGLATVVAVALQLLHRLVPPTSRIEEFFSGGFFFCRRGMA